MLNKILIILIILATVMIIWIIHQMFYLAGYSENCLQKPFNEVPEWCWEDK